MRAYMILACIVAGTSFLAVGCAVPQQTYNELKEKHSQLAIENDKLKSENAELRTNNFVLSEQLKGEAARLASAQDITPSLEKGEEGTAPTGEKPVGWQTNSKTGGIVLEDSIMFALGKATVSDKGKAVLKKLADLLNSDKYKDYLVRVDGHTDNIPVTTKENVDNWFLSAKRAHAVLTELAECGVKKERLFLAAHGEYDPIVPNVKGHGGTPKNRRVEISLIKER